MSQFFNQGVDARSKFLDYASDDRTKAVFNFFNTVYAWMAVGLAVTATVAYGVSHTPALAKLSMQPAIIWPTLIGTFLLSIGLQRSAPRIRPALGTALFLLYAGLIGFLISYIFFVYKMHTIGASFIVTAGTFAGLSVYGFVTKRDLTNIGGILIMAVWGLLLASIVNIFVASTAIDWIITYAVLAVFIGLTVYYTQKLRILAEQTADNGAMAARYAVLGSLVLYIAFLNMFMSILQIMGGNRR